MRRVNASQGFSRYIFILLAQQKSKGVGNDGLVEETESHVVIGFLLWLFLLLLFLLFGSGSRGSSTSGSGCSDTTSGWDGSQLLAALGNELVDALALQLSDDLVELLVVGVDSDGGDDGLDVSRRRLSVATEDSQKVSSHVTHVNFKSRRTRNVLTAQVMNLNRPM